MLRLNLDAGYPLGEGSHIYVSLFHNNASAERKAKASEKRSGVSVALSTAKMDFRVSAWAYSLTSGKDKLYGSIEASSEELYERDNMTLGGSIAFKLIDSDRFYVSPRLTMGWRLNPRMKLNGTIGMDHNLPTLSDSIIGTPEFDPYTELPETTTESFAAATMHMALTRLSSVNLTVDYRDIENAIYFERESSGWLTMHSMENCEGLTVTLDSTLS